MTHNNDQPKKPMFLTSITHRLGTDMAQIPSAMRRLETGRRPIMQSAVTVDTAERRGGVPMAQPDGKILTGYTVGSYNFGGMPLKKIEVITLERMDPTRHLAAASLSAIRVTLNESGAQIDGAFKQGIIKELVDAARKNHSSIEIDGAVVTLTPENKAELYAVLQSLLQILQNKDILTIGETTNAREQLNPCFTEEKQKTR